LFAKAPADANLAGFNTATTTLLRERDSGIHSNENAEGLKRNLVKRLEPLGQKVTLQPRESAASSERFSKAL
jgi:hypothetical protein